MQFRNITNLVFEGAGVGAIAYAGFLQKSEEADIFQMNNIKRVAGVSSGAIAAMQVALDYSTAEMIDEVVNTDFKKFADTPGGIIAAILRLFTREGIYKSEFLFRYICKLIKAKTGDEYITFDMLQKMKKQRNFKDLYVMSTKLFMINNNPAAWTFIFSHEHTPYTRVADAIRASAALPVIYPPMRLREELSGKYIIDSKGNIFVDGGIIEAYPISIFDYRRYVLGSSTNDDNNASTDRIFNPETLGLKLDTRANITLLSNEITNKKEQVIHTDFGYARALLYVLESGQQNIAFANSRERERTIFVDTLGISSTDFDISNRQKMDLINSGKIAAERVVKAYSFS